MPWRCGFDSRLCNMKKLILTVIALCAMCFPAAAQLPALSTIVDYGTTYQPGYSSSTQLELVVTAPAGYTFSGNVLITEVRWQGQWTVIDEPFNVTLPAVPHVMSGTSTVKRRTFYVLNGSIWPFNADGTVTVRYTYWYGVPYSVMTGSKTDYRTINGHALYWEPDEFAQITL